MYCPSGIPCSLTVSVLFVLNSGGNRLFCGVCLPGRTGKSSCSQGQHVKCKLYNFRQTCTYKANEPKHRNHSPSLGLLFETTDMFKTTHPCLRPNHRTASFRLSMWILCLKCGFEVFASRQSTGPVPGLRRASVPLHLTSFPARSATQQAACIRG